MLQFDGFESDGVYVLTCTTTPAGEVAVGGLGREALYKTLQDRPDPRFAIDLEAIDYLASADIGFLIGLKRRMDARRGRIVLFRVHPFVLDVLGTMKLSRYFELADDLPSALTALGPAAAS